MKIIVFCLPGLGDALLFTPALRFLRRRFPTAEIVALTMFESVRDVLATNPDLTSVECTPLMDRSSASRFTEALRLRRRHFDVSLTPYPAYRREYHLFSFAVGARTRVAHRFDRGFLSELTFLNTHTVPVDETLHNVENSANLLPPIGVPVDREALRQTPLTLTLTDRDEAAAGDFLRPAGRTGRRLVGVHPGTIHYRQAALRRWPPERFAELADRISRTYGTETLVFEGPSEEGLGDDVARRMTTPATVVRRLPIRTVAALIRRCALFVSNDSGLMHVAAAMARPVIAIFGQTDPRWVYPWQTRSAIVRADPDAAPSYRYTLRSFPAMPALAALKAEDVVDRTAHFLDHAFTD